MKSTDSVMLRLVGPAWVEFAILSRNFETSVPETSRLLTDALRQWSGMGSRSKNSFEFPANFCLYTTPIGNQPSQGFAPPVPVPTGLPELPSAMLSVASSDGHRIDCDVTCDGGHRPVWGNSVKLGPLLPKCTA